MKKTSLADIAAALGVSKTLVSMVLNGQGDLHGINTNTQKKVLDKAKELNYKPNRMARGLRTGRSNTIGLIVADIANPFYAKIARSIEDFANKTGYHMIFASSDENSKREEELIDMLTDRQVDGLIIASTLNVDTKEPLVNLHKNNIPYILIDRYIENLDADMVVSDNEKGAFDLTNHLLKKGRDKIALLTISPNHLSSIKDRIKGYKSALNVQGGNNEIIFNIPYESVEESVNKHLSDVLKNKTADAILTLNNKLANACIKYFKDNNISVPNDIAFASYDDVEWFEYVTPTITGMAQPIKEIGEKAIKLLIDKIKSNNNNQQPQHISLSAKLIERESSK